MYPSQEVALLQRRYIIGAFALALIAASSSFSKLILVGQTLDELLQGGELSLIDELKFQHKEDKVLETCVEMCLRSQLYYLLKMRVIDVSVNAEEAFQYVFYYAVEALGEGNA